MLAVLGLGLIAFSQAFSLVHCSSYFTLDPNYLQQAQLHYGHHIGQQIGYNNAGNSVTYVSEKKGGSGASESSGYSQVTTHEGHNGYGGYGGENSQHHGWPVSAHETEHTTKLGKSGVVKVLLVLLPFVVTIIFCTGLVILLGLLLLPVLTTDGYWADKARADSKLPEDLLNIVQKSLHLYNTKVK